MAKTLVDIDDSLLSAASAALGTRTKKDTVNAALREAVALQARREDLEWLRTGPTRTLARGSSRGAAWQR